MTSRLIYAVLLTYLFFLGVLSNPLKIAPVSSHGQSSLKSPANAEKGTAADSSHGQNSLSPHAVPNPDPKHEAKAGLLKSTLAKPSSPSSSSVDSTLLARLKLMAEYSAAAYCPANDDPISGSHALLTCAAKNCPDVEATKAATILRFENTAKTDDTGFIAIDEINKAIMVVFRGSVSEANWVADLQFFKKETGWCKDCMAHRGFLGAWNEIKSKVAPAIDIQVKKYPNYRVVFTGHSLGAAIATLAAGDMRHSSAYGSAIELYTYGSPRVGNIALVTFLTAQSPHTYRVTSTNDPVPRIPPVDFDYAHISPEYWLHSNPLKPSSADIEVLPGFINANGNSGQSGLVIESHRKYFGMISTCSQKDSSMSLGLVKRNATAAMSTHGDDDATMIFEREDRYTYAAMGSRS